MLGINKVKYTGWNENKSEMKLFTLYFSLFTFKLWHTNQRNDIHAHDKAKDELQSIWIQWSQLFAQIVVLHKSHTQFVKHADFTKAVKSSKKLKKILVQQPLNQQRSFLSLQNTSHAEACERERS